MPPSTRPPRSSGTCRPTYTSRAHLRPPVTCPRYWQPIRKTAPPAAHSGRGHDGAHGEAPEQAAPPGQRLLPYGAGASGQQCCDGPGVQAHDGHLPPCPHGRAMGTLGAWLRGPHHVFSLLASCGHPGVGPAGSLSEGSVPCVPDLPSADSPGTSGRLPSSGACPWALHPPCAVPTPHLNVAAGDGRGIPTDVDAGLVLRYHPGTGAGPKQAECGGAGGPRPTGGSVPHLVW